MRMCQINVAERIETHIIFSITFFEKVVLFMRYFGKYGRPRQATGDNIT